MRVPSWVQHCLDDPPPCTERGDRRAIRYRASFWPGTWTAGTDPSARGCGDFFTDIRRPSVDALTAIKGSSRGKACGTWVNPCSSWRKNGS